MSHLLCLTQPYPPSPSLTYLKVDGFLHFLVSFTHYRRVPLTRKRPPTFFRSTSSTVHPTVNKLPIENHLPTWSLSDLRIFGQYPLLVSLRSLLLLSRHCLHHSSLTSLPTVSPDQVTLVQTKIKKIK